MFSHKRYQSILNAFVLIGGTATVLNTQAAFGEICSMPNYDSAEYGTWLENLNFYKYWHSNDKSGKLSVKLRIAPTGFITSLALRDEGSSPYIAFSCLEAIASAAPFSPMPKKRHTYPDSSSDKTIENDFDPDRYQNIIDFESKQPEPALDAEKFYSEHPKLKNRCYLLHLIPLGINEHYPGLFSNAELMDQKNLVPLKANIEPDEAIQPFLDDWQAFISTHKNATKDEIFHEASIIKARHQPMLIVFK